MKTLYDWLGITPQASPKAIQQSFFRMAKKFDPANPVNRDHPDAREQYRAIRDAYKTLSDPDERRKYDISMQRPSLSERVKAERAARAPRAGQA